MGKENLNPFSAKGFLSFRSFSWSLIAIVIVNLIIYAFVRSWLIQARASLDKPVAAFLYVIWFISATAGFTVVANTFIKRWNDILGETKMSPVLKSLFRFSLLSPLLGLPITFVTMLFFPRSPLNDVNDGGSKSGILSLLVVILALSIGLSVYLPSSLFGLERIGFRDSANAFVTSQFNGGKNPLPSETAMRPILAVATPALRYVGWLASDFIRTRMLFMAVENEPAKNCSERLGFIKVEVQDCYFNQLRKMTTQVPMIAPYFALFFEAEYRKKVSVTLIKSPAHSAVEPFASSILMVSNLVELLEPGPMFIERAHLLQPSFLLHAYASPELALVEAGQDIQRMAIVERLLPIIDGQIEMIQTMIKTMGSSLGPDEIGVRAEMRDLAIRIAAIRKDPLMLAGRRTNLL